MRIRGGDVELWGLPGAGKSTVSRVLKKKYNIDVPSFGYFESRKLLYLSSLRCVLSDPRMAATLLASRGRVDFRRRKTLLAWAAGQRVAFGHRGVGPVVFEEGVAHEVWRALLADGSLIQEEWWKRFLRYAGPTVVVLDVDPDVAYRRLCNKTRLGPVNQKLKAAPFDGKLWNDAISCYHVVKESLDQISEVRKVEIETAEMSLDEVCRHVADIFHGDVSTRG